MKLQCGYEDTCKARDCFHCRRFIKFKPRKQTLTLAEATCIEDFAQVDLDMWQQERPKQRLLAQNIMRKLCRRIKW